MPKIVKIKNSNQFLFDCPACECSHFFNDTWTFNGDFENPTVSPSLKVTGGEKGKNFVCHFFIKNGMIEYCADSSHDLRGQIVPMSEI